MATGNAFQMAVGNVLRYALPMIWVWHALKILQAVVEAEVGMEVKMSCTHGWCLPPRQLQWAFGKCLGTCCLLHGSFLAVQDIHLLPHYSHTNIMLP
jgi:hypothetical protein